MRRLNYREVPIVECGDSSDTQTLSDGHDCSVDESEIEIPLRLHEVSDTGIVSVLQVHDLEGFIKDGVEEAHLVFHPESPTEHPACLRHDWSRNEEALFGSQEIAARLMVRFALTARFEQDACVDDQHDGSVEAE